MAVTSMMMMVLINVYHCHGPQWMTVVSICQCHEKGGVWGLWSHKHDMQYICTPNCEDVGSPTPSLAQTVLLPLSSVTFKTTASSMPLCVIVSSQNNEANLTWLHLLF